MATSALGRLEHIATGSKRPVAVTDEYSPKRTSGRHRRMTDHYQYQENRVAVVLRGRFYCAPNFSAFSHGVGQVRTFKAKNPERNSNVPK